MYNNRLNKSDMGWSVKRFDTALYKTHAFTFSVEREHALTLPFLSVGSINLEGIEDKVNWDELLSLPKEYWQGDIKV